jgi:hypothetical protein
MSRIGNVPEINAVKTHLEELKSRGLIREWEIPYEHILTRLTAAIFFLTPAEGSGTEEIWQELERHPRLQYQLNEEKKLSAMTWRVEFNKGFTS